MNDEVRNAMTKADLINIVARKLEITQVQAGIIEKENPLHLSNVMLVCTQCKRRTRVGFRINDEGRKVRVCKHCKQDID